LTCSEIAVRFEQFDGTSALPFKSNGKFHLAGKVIVTPPEIFKKFVENTVPIIKAAGNKPCIILPPLPRYLFSRCCGDENHCTNASDKEFCETLLTGFAQLKRNLISHLVNLGVTNFKVMDFCCATTCTTTANNPERLHGLKSVYTSDGVHLTTDVHRNLATRSIECLNTLMATPKKRPCHATYFWRGFISRRGSSLPRNYAGNLTRSGSVSVGNNSVAGGSRGRSRGSPLIPRGFHPYCRW
jgi:hypothetical protein